MPETDKGVWRDLVAFWILGLCNNYGFIVMLCSAHDIIERFSDQTTAETSTEPNKNRPCQLLSTGTILLANILPSFLMKSIIPFLPFWMSCRVIVAIVLSASSFIVVAFATSKAVAILGVVLASASCGMGESSFLAYSSMFDKNVISTWSSGTGGAGISGSTTYATMREMGLSSRYSMLIMLIVPMMEAATFFVILRNPSDTQHGSIAIQHMEEVPFNGFMERLAYVKELVRYIVPLSLVYFCQYFINQGLFELVYFENCFLAPKAQYRWLLVDYQIGVFIGRSSVNLFHFRAIWLTAVLQSINVLYFLSDAIFFYTPTIWIAFIVVLWEGLVGGASYVNTFYCLSYDIPPPHRLFALGFVANSDSYGITTAGIMAIQVHNAICKLPAKQRP